MTLIKKTTKTLVLGVALLGLAVGASSWASTNSKLLLNDDELFWDYNGNPELTSPDHSEESNYSRASNQDATCINNTKFCQIKAPVKPSSSPEVPDLSAPSSVSGQTIQDRIEDAQQNGPNETVSMKN
ncbi:hypothetical protein [Sphingobacterium lumbrici]|uniref:hypothetical protein n=1 Tax=Sphingobacterium lumbrici TaxID=2559600 RepID=UPI00112D3725|nr:hypothetical protein [Sphingobacterium lumbrici]